MKKISLILALSLVMISLESLADYAPKVYIENNNTASVAFSVGVKAIVNSVEPTGSALYVKPGETKLIGQLGVDRDEIISLDVRASSGGEGKLSGIGKRTVYPITDTLNTWYSQRKSHPNQDILIAISNPGMLGYWEFSFSWRDRLDSEPTTLDVAINGATKEKPIEKPAPGPAHNSATNISQKREAKKVEIKQIDKPIQGQGASSLAAVILPEGVQKELNAVIAKRKKASESGDKK